MGGFDSCFAHSESKPKDKRIIDVLLFSAPNLQMNCLFFFYVTKNGAQQHTFLFCVKELSFLLKIRQKKTLSPKL